MVFYFYLGILHMQIIQMLKVNAKFHFKNSDCIYIVLF